MYEVVPAGVETGTPVRGVDPLRYGPRGGPSEAPVTTAAAPPPVAGGRRDELLFVKLRYKVPGQPTSRLLTEVARDRGGRAGAQRASEDLRFASAVAEFGMLLRGSPYRGEASGAAVVARARGAMGDDPGGSRAGFVQLVERWRALEGGVAMRE